MNINFLAKNDSLSINSAKKAKNAIQIDNPSILKSLEYLKQIKFNPDDIKTVQKMGVILPFMSGEDSFNFIKNENIIIKFEKLSLPNTHAQYDFENNVIKINELYKNTQNPAEILAISEAIFHETGHAKDKDGQNSIQEEIDCLALNALAHRSFLTKYSDIFKDSNTLIVQDGVKIYEQLFFDFDPQKNKLVERLKEKYGFLPAGDFNHPPRELAFRVK